MPAPMNCAVPRDSIKRPARFRPYAAAVVILACSTAGAAEDEVTATPKSAKVELDRLMAISPLDPQTLRARLDYAISLSRSDDGDCVRNQQLAAEQLQTIIDTPAHALVMTPDLAPVATGVLANTQLNQAMCTEDETKAK